MSESLKPSNSASSVTAASESQPDTPLPSPPPKTGLWHEVKPRVVAYLIAQGLLWVGSGIGLLLFTSKAWQETAANKGKVDVHLVLTGNIKPGTNIELHPVSELALIGDDGQKWFRGIAFSTLQNTDLEVRLLNGPTRTTLATVPIGERPVIHIQQEVK